MVKYKTRTNKENPTVIGAYVDQAVYKTVKQLSAKNKLSMSYYVQEALYEYFDRKNIQLVE